MNLKESSPSFCRCTLSLCFASRPLIALEMDSPEMSGKAAWNSPKASHCTKDDHHALGMACGNAQAATSSTYFSTLPAKLQDDLLHS